MVQVLPDRIGARSLGTGTTQTQLSGDRSGNATDYTVPAWARAILAVRADLAVKTPTAGQTAFATLKLGSNDLNFGNFEVFVPPVGSALSTVAASLTTGMNISAYPLNLKVNGGEKIQFYGQAQVANAVAPTLGATVWLSNQPPTEPQWYSLAMSKINNSSNPVSTGTATGKVAGTSFTISGSGGTTIKAIYGVISSGTIVASDDVQGFFQIEAPEIPVPPRFNAEPVQGFLGTTGQVQNLISKLEGMNLRVQTPTSIAPSLTLETAPANAGVFEIAVMYQ